MPLGMCHESGCLIHLKAVASSSQDLATASRSPKRTSRQLHDRPPRRSHFLSLDALLLCSPLRLPADVKTRSGRRRSRAAKDERKVVELLEKDDDSAKGPFCSQVGFNWPQLDEDPFRAVLRLHDLLMSPVIAKLDVDGAFAVDESGAWHVHDEAVRVVETTGAGDALAGAVLAAIASGRDIATATALGVSVARLALSDWGAGGLMNSRPLTRPLSGVRTRRK